ncbi:MAG: ribosome biogenesis GTPase Der [Chitinispirillaceae bacterium]|nr:ribosome biogenesis GTPase Der [Chitinispirillaceae bacterium]
MSSPPIISIIGRPNVGKSCLFNRIIGKRRAVVDDKPGVTRDRNYYTTEWNGETVMLVDTGGLLPADRRALPRAVSEQVRIALSESAAVLFLVDATTGPTDIDLQIARQIRRKASERVLCIVNKAESRRILDETGMFQSLGLGKAYPVSALHGSGVADVLDEAIAIIRAKRAGEATSSVQFDPLVRLAIVGRPNTGKSSLVNMLLRKKRMIVDDEPGTTRDAVDSLMTYHGGRIVLIDTAGLRKKSHVKHDMEYYANLRALESIERCDVCALLVDVTGNIGLQDLRIVHRIIESRKGVLLAWNKWDLLSKDHKTFDQLVAQSRRQYKELRFIPMIAVSALTGQRTTTVVEMALQIKERLVLRVGVTEFEDHFFSWVRTHPHPAVPENPVRFLGAKQIAAPFPLFHFFTSNPKGVVPSYHRYLMNKIYETYNFQGCPVVIEYRPAKRPKRRHYNFTTNAGTAATAG